MTYHVQELKKKVDEIFEQVVAFRRELHMYPERSEQEENTSTMIQAELNRLGIPYQSNIAGYGVCATIYG